MLLPYFEEAGLAGIYDNNKQWLNQRPDVAATVIPVYACPSAGGDNPYLDKVLNLIFVAVVGNGYEEMGVTNYAFCKGVTDAWCGGPKGEPPGPPHAHEPCRPQQSELMGNGRFGHPDERGQIADTSLAVGQGVHEPHARRVAEQPEDLRNRLDGSRTQE